MTSETGLAARSLGHTVETRLDERVIGSEPNERVGAESHPSQEFDLLAGSKPGTSAPIFSLGPTPSRGLESRVFALLAPSMESTP